MVIRKVALCSLFIVLLVAVWTLTLQFPHVGAAFVLPGAAIFLMQLLASSRWPHKDTFFKLADYVYYLLIGGVVGLGSRYVYQMENVERLDAMLEVTSLRQQLAEIDRDVPRLQEELRKLERVDDTADDELTRRFLAEQLTPKLRPPDTRNDRPPALRADPCRAQLESVYRKSVLPGQITSLERQRIRIAEQLGSTPDLSATALPKGMPTAKPAEQLKVELIWIPTLILIGVAIKLGKTTCALTPLPKVREN